MASRHLSRVIAFQTLFEWDFRHLTLEEAEKLVDENLKEFGPDIEDKDYPKNLVKGVILHKKEIDEIIETNTKSFTLSQMSPVDRNILRLGCFELLFEDKNTVPSKLAIDEAIEMAKAFGGDHSQKFINGVLATIYQKFIENKDEELKNESNNDQENIE